MLRMVLRFTLWACGPAIVSLLLLGGCPWLNPDGNDNTNGASDPDVETQRVLDVIENAAADLDALPAGTPVTDALNQLAADLNADPAVESTEIGGQGLAVQCTNGIRLFYVTDPFDDDPDNPNLEPADIENEGGGAPKPRDALEKGMAPKSTRTLLYNPHYWERKNFSAKIEQYGNAAFAASGLNPFEIYRGEQCTLAVLRTLSDYGVIHFYSHGIAWPSGLIRNEIYMLTGQSISQELAYQKLPVEVSERRRAMQDGKLAAGFMKFQLATETAPIRRWMILVSPTYLAEKNDLGTNRPLIYRGFCWSDLGTWPQMMTTEGVGGHLGFDWWVKTRESARWACKMYRDMGSHAVADPRTLAEWYDGLDYRSYTLIDKHFGNVERTVTLKKGGSDSLTLWESAAASRILGSLTVDNRIRDIAVYNDLVLAIDHDVGLTAYVGGRGTPAKLGSLTLSMHSSGRGVTTDGSIAYVSCGSFRMVDISTVSAMQALEGVGLNSDCNASVVAGGLAYIAAGDLSYSQDDGVFGIVDVTEPAVDKGRARGGLDIGSYIRGVGMLPDGKTVCLADLYGSVYFVNVTDPANPVLLSEFDPTHEAYSGGAGAIRVVGTTVYVLTTSLAIIDASNPSAPVELWSVMNSSGYDIAVANNRIYIVGAGEPYGTGVMGIWDVTDPRNPVGGETINLPGMGQCIEVVGNTAYVGQSTSDGKGILTVVDVTP
ncbi:MAG: hypothetical protein AMXMBFR47_13410 [Planctomycetota bacterium]